MRISELMTRDVVTVSPETSVREVAKTLLAHGISGAPVCDAANHVLGVISSKDIVQAQQGLPSQSPRFLFRFTGESRTAKPDPRTAQEAMSQPAIVVFEITPVRGAAHLMLQHGVHRLPVLRGNQLCGIVTATDLLWAYTRPDAEIRREIVNELRTQRVDLAGPNGEFPEVEVRDGVVVATGEVQRRSHIDTVREVIAGVPGVQRIDLDLKWRIDERSQPLVAGL